MSLETPNPDGVLELFRDEIAPREAGVGPEYDEAVEGLGGATWDNPFPGVETLTSPGRPMHMRVTYRRLITGAYDEGAASATSFASHGTTCGRRSRPRPRPSSSHRG